MFRTLPTAKCHRATGTRFELHCDGSCGIDEDLLEASNIRPDEQAHIWNVNNGERCITDAIQSPRGSGIISLNGSAARRARVGDRVITAAFGRVHEDKLDEVIPKLVFPDAANRIVETRSEPAGPQAGDPPLLPIDIAH